jgi:hypothetical protein
VHTLLECVYLDCGARGHIVAVRPKVEFAPLFFLVAGSSADDVSGPTDRMPHGELTPVVPATDIQSLTDPEVGHEEEMVLLRQAREG